MWRKAWSIILSLLLLAGIGFILFVGARAVAHFATHNSSIATAIITAAAAVLVSVLSIVLGKLYESRSLIKKEHREKTIPVYEDLITFMFRILMSTKTGNPPSEEEIVKFMSDFTPRAMVWGSDEVLLAWVKWRRTSIDQVAMKTGPMKPMFVYEELILAIRRDLGHKNKGLLPGNILSLFINDIDQHLPR